MHYRIQYDSDALEDLRKVPKSNLLQIRTAIETRLTIDPVALGKPLRGNLKGYLRLRVGDWRIIYQVRQDYSVLIVAVGNRKDIYQ